MAYTVSDVEAKVRSIVKEAVEDTGDILVHIEGAMHWYSSVFPLLCTEVVQYDNVSGGYPMPDNYSDGISSIVSIYDTDNDRYVSIPGEMRVVNTGSGVVIKPTSVLYVPDSIIITYTAPRAYSDIVSEGHLTSIAYYAASLIISTLAAKYSGVHDDMFPGQVINYRTRGQDLLGVARALRNVALSVFGMSERDQVPPASISVG